jgi:hypothetical protein
MEKEREFGSRVFGGFFLWIMGIFGLERRARLPRHKSRKTMAITPVAFPSTSHYYHYYY